MEVGVQIVICICIVATFVINVSSTRRGFQQPCGAPLHARSRESLEARQCDYTRGLVCSSGICECNNLSGSIDDRPVWNRTHCVVKLNDTCRIVKSYGPGLPFLPNVTHTEELSCGTGAICTYDQDCWCEEGLVPDKHGLNCVADSGQPVLGVDGNIILFAFFFVSRFV
ncbi:unnamed protein product [Orchesella dallaii]|uniref:EB domain-containing protein n=1 Tax=Orchesella dallaii TaxID=48710 RepID=A0ABP1RDL5_9HEXA